MAWFGSTLWLKTMRVRARVHRAALGLASLTLTALAVLGLGLAWYRGWIADGATVPSSTEFLVGVGATIATVLTLAISLSIISVQRAAEDFSPGLVRAYRSDRTLGGVFFAIAFIALGNFGLAMLADRVTEAAVLVTGLLSFALALDALRWIYARVGRALEPIEAMAYMLQIARRDAGRYARMARLVQRSMTPSRPVVAGDAPIAAVAFAAVPEYAATLRTWSDYFAEDAIRALGRNQTMVAIVATRCIGALVKQALAQRRHDVAFQTNIEYLLLRQADIQSVLQHMYDRLSRIGNRGLAAKEDQLAIEVIKTLCSSAFTAAAIRDPLQPMSAPLAFAPFTTARDLIRAGIAANDLEVVFQGGNVVTDVAKGMAADLRTSEIALPAAETAAVCAVHLRAMGNGGLAESMLGGIARLVARLVLEGTADQVEDVEDLLRPALALQVQPSASAGWFCGDSEWIDRIARELYGRATAAGTSARDRDEVVTTFCEFCEQLARHLREIYRRSPEVDAVRATEIRVAAQRLLATLVSLSRREELRGSPELVEAVDESIEDLLSVFSWVLYNQRNPHVADLDDVASLLLDVVYRRAGADNWEPTVAVARILTGLAQTCVDRGWSRQAADALVSVWQIERVVEARGDATLAVLFAENRRAVPEARPDLQEEISERFEHETARLQRVLEGREWIGRDDREEIEFLRAVRGEQLGAVNR